MDDTMDANAAAAMATRNVVWPAAFSTIALRGALAIIFRVAHQPASATACDGDLTSFEL